jgi:hypothetical protein
MAIPARNALIEITVDTTAIATTLSHARGSCGSQTPGPSSASTKQITPET